jgi:hypothetical protein
MGLLRESWQDVAKVFVAAVIIDLIYQIMELRWFYPEEALIVATCLALLPYLLLGVRRTLSHGIGHSAGKCDDRVLLYFTP